MFTEVQKYLVDMNRTQEENGEGRLFGRTLSNLNVSRTKREDIECYCLNEQSGKAEGILPVYL